MFCSLNDSFGNRSLSLSSALHVLGYVREPAEKGREGGAVKKGNSGTLAEEFIAGAAAAQHV